jgi:acetoin:2,6-dichlorophenolindophenol oxidoreductase subunit beta
VTTSVVPAAASLTYREAINEAIGDAMKADPDVFLVGEDVGEAGGVFKVTDGLHARFGPERVLDTPISEQAIIGLAIGAAIQGLRPLAELMFADFAAVAFDQLVNQLPKYRYMTGGQVRLPVTVRLANGGGSGFAAQHSQAAENWVLGFPGLKVAVPATPADAYGLLRAAIADDNPVLFFEHKSLLNLKGAPPGEAAPLELGRADVVRTGHDVTVVATQLMRHRALEAADLLDAEGISVELIDPRTLVPFDDETIVASVERTNRLVVVQECTPGGSWGATLIARVVGEHLELFDSPPVMVGTDETPTPYSGVLEDAWLPSVERIAAQVRATVSD